MNRLDGFVDIAHLARPVRGDPLNVCVLTQGDECSAALGRYPDHADTRPRSFVAHTASLAGTCHAIVEGSLNRPGLPEAPALGTEDGAMGPKHPSGSGTRPPPRGTRPPAAAGAVGAELFGVWAAQAVERSTPGSRRPRPSSPADAEFLLGDPGGQQLPGGLVRGDLLPQPDERLIGQALAVAQQPPTVRPGWGSC